MDRRIAPSLVEKSPILVELVEEVDISVRPQPVKIANLEIGPLHESQLKSKKGLKLRLQNGNGYTNLRRHHLATA